MPDPRRMRHTAWTCSASTCSTIACLAVPMKAGAAGGVESASATGPLGWLLVGAAIALGAVFTAHAGLRRGQRQLSLLRMERLRGQRLSALIDGVRWRTDDAHRLLHASEVPAHAHSPWHGAGAGQPVWSAFVEPDAAILRERLESRKGFEDIEADVAGQPGPATRSWRLRAVPAFDDEGRFDGYEGVAVPVAAALPAASAPVTEAAPEDDSATEAFIYTVSHDLRAPIRVIEGFTRILKEDYGRALDRIGNDHLDRVLGASARMNSMIDALLELSRLSSQPLVRQPVHLSQLAGYVVDDLKRQHPDGVVQVRIQPGLMAQGDPTLLRVAIENLLGNAWKYSAKATRPEIVFERARHGDRDCFVVRDNGAGFDMRFADRLFGAFQRLHSANDFQGTGIGLASVKRIVARHGGQVWAEGEVGRGARFYFTLEG